MAAGCGDIMGCRSFCRAPGHSAKHDAFLCQSTELLQHELRRAPWQQQHISQEVVPLRDRWARMDRQTDFCAGTQPACCEGPLLGGEEESSPRAADAGWWEPWGGCDT